MGRLVSVAQAVQPALPAAQEATEAAHYPVVDLRQQTKEIRGRVCDEFLAGGLVYVSGGDCKHRNGADVYHKFRPDSSFAYLTGVAEPGFGALIDPASRRFTLVAPKVPDDAAVWWGGLPSLDALAEQAGADDACYAEDLGAHVAQHYAGADTLHVLPSDLPEHQAALLAHPHFAAHAPLQQQHFKGLLSLGQGSSSSGSSSSSNSSGGLRFSATFLEPTLTRCRAHKTAAEVGCLLEASQGSAAAHRALWRALRPGVREFQLEAAFTGEALRQGNMQLGYPCIVGAGRNAAILHYERNSARVGDGDLVLVDAGAEFRCYTADITRTAPASGRFSPVQRDVYELVLSLQLHALDMVRPGVAWPDVQASTRRLLLEQLQQLGLVSAAATPEALAEAGVDKVFMPHGLGHFLGLDVHDVSEVGPVPQALEAGHVITVEPGVYFMPLLLERAFADAKQAPLLVRARLEPLLGLGGVRIEDNVLLTPGGHLNLTMAVGMQKSVREVEECVRGAQEQA